MRDNLPILAILIHVVLADFDQCTSINGVGTNSPTFSSPNFPGNYPPNVDCVRVIQALPAHDILVKFHYMFHIESTYDKLEAGDECPNDFIEFRDGRYGFSPLIRRYCGNQMPKEEIRAVSGFLWLRFRSDSMLEYQGFSAEYTNVASIGGKVNTHECLMEYLNGLDGFIRSKDLISSLPKNASGTLDCTWKLLVDPKYHIAFYIKDFQLKNPNQCSENFFGDLFKGHIEFCGLTASDVFSPANVMYVRIYLSNVQNLNATSITALFSSYARLKNCTHEGMFACGDENCVPKVLACNGRPNCPYGRDEHICSVAQDTVKNFIWSGFAPLCFLVFCVFVAVSLICFYTIRKNRCALPPLI
ncbi:unnamed protein product [Caenorhabditis angaria]|uniref:CUB domain-containing protein n=1 Tax=Caenorhabditis angaria TaxID=860376 RepID=A0A9P1MWF1_9PELO|nr:unnamed protein product [Caenorhabditis angaria]